MSFEHGGMSQQAAPARTPRSAPSGVLRRLSVTGKGRVVAWARVSCGINNQVFANLHVEPGRQPLQTRELLINGLISGVHSLKSRDLVLVCAYGRWKAAGRFVPAVQRGHDPPGRRHVPGPRGRRCAKPRPRLRAPPLTTGHDVLGPADPPGTPVEMTARLLTSRAPTHP
jgi:hypothetical protein